jgi:hypothetical protein
MSKDDSSNKVKSLSDSDIATYARRAGPASVAPGTDSDAHSDSDAAATDHDTAPATDKDN